MTFIKTIPVKDVLVLNPIEEAEVTEALALYTKGIDEFVAFGTHLIEWQYKQPDLTDESMPILSLFRRIVELADAVSVLLKSRAVDPCEVLMRTLFETALSLEYLLKEDTDRRALCYLFDSHADRAAYLRRFNAKDQNHRSLRQSFESGRVFKEIPEFAEYMRSELDYLDAWLNHPGRADVKVERDRVRKIPAKQWYSPFSDETNKDAAGNGKILKTFKDLAEHLGRFDLYEILYRQWSKSVHGSDAITGNFLTKGGDIHIIALRQPIKAHAITTFLLGFLGDVFVSINAYNKRLYGERYKDMADRVVQWAQDYHVNYSVPINDKKIGFEDL